MAVSSEQPDLEYRSADSISVDELIATLNRGFENYFVPIRLDSRALLRMIRVDSVELSASVVAQHGGKHGAIALVARRGWTCRLAAMAIDPDWRGKRIGTHLTQFLLRAARERGDRHFVLECIEQNTPGVRLYQSAGFAAVRRLVGYTADSIASQEDAALEEIDATAVAAAVSRWSVPNLPWQISPHVLTALGPPHRAFRLGSALALFSDPAAETVTLSALVVDPDARRRGWATRLLRALSARFPGKKWRFSIVIPEEIPGDFFSKLNFRKERLTQIQMARAL